ncbi:uncharacterized protein TRIREDRAFT_78042 [Trichoderma reesei QM6a]|uniref:Predicted protein n=2 Tax=Hypocrea jecorina TaxID=51453 RepID=G0RJR1_HYPJQ|nr:uncharacterized protein TRIREDRAFT_78042 [Trichoderma reesei QM6a]EGR48637.1 predicted protein [Trichoderma reesei QM6a]ETS01592.1 hypothetical protein M419DRAFT_137524 [Trichoderma reesei RUT C-30]
MLLGKLCQNRGLTDLTLRFGRATWQCCARKNSFRPRLHEREDWKSAFSPTPLSSPVSVVSDTLTARPTTPSSPVQIPRTTSRESYFDTAHPVRRHHNLRRKAPSHVRSPESLSPSVAALLAVTDIPRPRRTQRKSRGTDKLLTADVIIADERSLSEKEFSWSLSRGSPMEVLMSPPDSLDEEFLGSDCGSVSMARTLSVDSMPSLGDSFGTECISSIDTPRSSSPQPLHRRKASPIRSCLGPIRSPPDSIVEHPLSPEPQDEDGLDSLGLQSTGSDATTSYQFIPFKPLRAVFKSNLTASLRALRSAAKSFSNLNFPTIPPDDLITRSILTMDPKVPYADERRPPVTEEIPSAELRRYLNPTTRLSRETQSRPLQQPGTFAASIQMQTYKIQRSRPTDAAARNAYPSASPLSPSSAAGQPAPTPAQDSMPPLPAMRQREMRENPDFIRIAVMEMLMRRRGKLDNSKPGRARWALPPRKTSTKPYAIGPDGVPERWVPLSAAA